MRRCACLLTLLLAAAGNAAPDVSFSVTSNAIGSGSAGGNILVDGSTVVGTWSVSSFAFTRLTSVGTYTPTIFAIAETATGNTYGAPGIGIRMQGDGSKHNGVTSFTYTVAVTLTDDAYAVENIAFWGKAPNTVNNYGPPDPQGDGGSLVVSGFPGLGLVLDPDNNLVADHNQSFASGTNLNGWLPGNGLERDWLAPQVTWQISVPGGSPVTFLADYRTLAYSAANEATAFTIDIGYAAPVPEPSTHGLTLGALALGLVALRRRRRARD